MCDTKNNIAWERIFNDYSILDKIDSNGYASISSADINKYREARLMTKFDHRSQLPKLFIENELSILPTSRGTYNIGTFKTFYDFNKEEDGKVTYMPFPSYIESINYTDLTSEAMAINCAYVSNLLQDFTDEAHLWPTVCGRMGTPVFDFKIDSNQGYVTINVENAQIEIDGGYEGDNSLILIEAKNYIAEDFQVRQLYYPYRLWKEKVTKNVRPIFLTYSNGIFHLREYEFTDYKNYNSINLVKYEKYTVENIEINIDMIQRILSTVNIIDEPRVPFPQADSFDRVINLCELLKQKRFISKENITQNYDFDYRQTDYYSNAARYLGLLDNVQEEGQIGCVLTTDGERIFNLPIKERQLAFIKLILSHKAFNETLKLYLEKADVPSKDDIILIMKQSNLYNIDSDETYRRRASTIISWLNWILELINL